MEQPLRPDLDGVPRQVPFGFQRASGLAQDLRVPYGNHLEALKDDRKDQHSIRVNNQWRICFRWQGEEAWDVEIVDYH